MIDLGSVFDYELKYNANAISETFLTSRDMRSTYCSYLHSESIEPFVGLV